MEPITLALTAFSAIKAGVSAGKEITSLAGDIGKLWDAIDNVKKDHQKERKSPVNTLKGVNEEALETFIALQKAKDLEDELREIIIYTRGMEAWQDLLRLRAKIKNDRLEAERQARIARNKKKERIQEILIVIAAALLGVGALIGFVMWLKLMKSGT